MENIRLNNLKNRLKEKKYDSIWFSLDKGIMKKFNSKRNYRNLVNVTTDINSNSSTPVSIKLNFYNQNGGNLELQTNKTKVINYSIDEIKKSNYKLNFSKINNLCLLTNSNLLKKNSYNSQNINTMNTYPIADFNLKGGFIYHVFEGGSEESNKNTEVVSVNNGTYPGKSKLTEAGSGVFSNKNFKEGDILEVVPVLAIPIKDTKENILKDYVFMYDAENYGMALGYGSMYNHQNDPNVSYSYSDDKKFMQYSAIKDINSGDELFISYGLGWWVHRNITPKDIKQ